jgi:hypothetical protein
MDAADVLWEGRRAVRTNGGPAVGEGAPTAGQGPGEGPAATTAIAL